MTRVEELLHSLMDGVKKEKAPPPKDYKCQLCKDMGFIPVQKDTGMEAKVCPECLKRAERRRWMKQSGITEEAYQRFTMETFKTDTTEAQNMKALAVEFLHDESATGLGIFGRAGTGKTHLCVAVCQAIGKEHYYWQYRREIQRIKAVMFKDFDEYERLLFVPTTKPYLYIDDLFKGAMVGSEIAQQDKQIMFDIINMRYVKKLPTILSSEYSLKSITIADEAIGSRIYEMCHPHLLKVQGANRRLNKF